MKDLTGLTDAGKLYAAAHSMHHTEKKLFEALGLYSEIISDHPDSGEADYARTQIRNIVVASVPVKELFDAQVALAMAHFEQTRETAAVGS